MTATLPALPSGQPYDPAPDLATLHPEPFTPGAVYLLHPASDAACAAARRLIDAGVIIPDELLSLCYRYEAPACEVRP
mgnify:CR=1 FL=1